MDTTVTAGAVPSAPRHRTHCCKRTAPRGAKADRSCAVLHGTTAVAWSLSCSWRRPSTNRYPNLRRAGVPRCDSRGARRVANFALTSSRFHPNEGALTRKSSPARALYGDLALPRRCAALCRHFGPDARAGHVPLTSGRHAQAFERVRARVNDAAKRCTYLAAACSAIEARRGSRFHVLPYPAATDEEVTKDTGVGARAAARGTGRRARQLVDRGCAGAAAVTAVNRPCASVAPARCSVDHTRSARGEPRGTAGCGPISGAATARIVSCAAGARMVPCAARPRRVCSTGRRCVRAAVVPSARPRAFARAARRADERGESYWRSDPARLAKFGHEVDEPYHRSSFVANSQSAGNGH